MPDHIIVATNARGTSAREVEKQSWSIESIMMNDHVVTIDSRVEAAHCSGVTALGVE